MNQVLTVQMGKVKINIKNKLRRAIDWIKVFEGMCEDAKVERLKLEAQAQTQFLQGLLLIEQEKYTEALEALYMAKAILTGLLKTVGTIQKAHIEEKMGQIDNNVRFCKYELNEYDGAQDEDQMIELQRALQSDPTSALKLEDVVQRMSGDKEGSSKSMSVDFFGKNLEIQNEKLIILLNEIRIMEKSITSNYEDAEKDMAMFTEMFSVYDDASKLVENKLKEGLSDAVQKIWEDIQSYVIAQKQMDIVRRNKILIQTATLKFEKENGYETIFHDKVNYGASKPQNVVKLYDLSIDQVSQLKEKMMDMKADFNSLQILEDFYRTMRCFFVGCYHVSQGNHLYGISLFRGIKNQIENVEKEMSTVSNMEYKVRNLEKFKS